MTLELLLISGFHVGVGLFVAFVVAMALLERGGALREPRSVRWLLIGLAPFLVLSLLLPWGPVHEHLSFVARGECAFVPTCKERFPWARPALDGFGALLHLLPGTFDPESIVAASWVLELSALVVLFGAIHKVRDLRESALAPEHAAALTLAVVASNLAWVRVATGGTLWSLTVFWLACSFLLCGAGARSGSRIYTLAAVWALTLAAVTNAAALPLLGVLPVAWFAFLTLAPRRQLARADLLVGAIGFVVAGLLFVPFVLEAWANVDSTGGLDRDPLQTLGNTPIFRWRHTSLVTIVAGCAGAGIAIARERAYLPVLAALLATEWILAPQVVPWTVGYPTYYIHTHLTGFLFAILAALGIGCGLDAIRHRIPACWSVAPVGVLIAVGALTSEHGRQFATERRVLDQEVELITAALKEIPEHECLVLPPVRPPSEGEPVSGCDPLDVYFPTAAYVEARRATGSADICLLSYDDATYGSKGDESSWLVYVGSGVLSWTPCEIEAGHVPDGIPHRRSLRALDARWLRVPAFTRQVATAQHPAVGQRLLADRLPHAELGFFYLEPLDPGATRQHASADELTDAEEDIDIRRLFEPLEIFGDTDRDLPGGCRLADEKIEPPVVSYTIGCPHGGVGIRFAAEPAEFGRVDDTYGPIAIMVEPPEMLNDPAVARLIDIARSRASGRPWRASVPDTPSDGAPEGDAADVQMTPGCLFRRIGLVGFGFALVMLAVARLGLRRQRGGGEGPR